MQISNWNYKENKKKKSERKIYSFFLSRLTFKSDTIKAIKLPPCQRRTKTSEAPDQESQQTNDPPETTALHGLINPTHPPTLQLQTLQRANWGSGYRQVSDWLRWGLFDVHPLNRRVWIKDEETRETVRERGGMGIVVGLNIFFWLIEICIFLIHAGSN